jgi:hypothetical protein
VSRRGPLLAALVGVAAGASLLAGCSSSPPASSAKTSSTASGSPGYSTEVSVPGQQSPPYSAATNARPDVTTSVCAQDTAGAWVLNGTVTNRTSATHTYTIVIDWIDKGDTVQQSKVVTVPSLAPRKTLSWSVSGASGLSGIQCVVRSARL